MFNNTFNNYIPIQLFIIVCIVIILLLVIVSIFFNGTYKVKYKQWIHHPLNFNLVFKWKSFYDKNNFNNYIKNIDFTNISTSSLSNLNQINKSFIKNFDKHINDFDIVSIQNKTCSIIDHKSKNLIEDSIISACVTSFEIFNPQLKQKLFYINNLMLDYTNLNLHTKNNILLQHLDYYINKNNINFGLFKYNILPFLTPLSAFNCYTFPVTKWRQPPSNKLHPKFKLIPLSKQNFHLFTNFVKTLNINNSFEIILHANYERIMYLIYNSFWFANLLLFEDNVVAFYFFNIQRKSALHCFASVNKCDNPNDFIYAFKLSFWNIANKNNCTLASIDSVSHNNTIIHNIIKKTHPSTVTPFAFYFYNFEKYFSIPHHNCLFIL